MKYIGVDPGLNGAIVIMDDNLIVTRVMPTIVIKKGKKNKKVLYHKGLKEIFEVMEGESYAIIEKQHAMPKEGVSSMVTIGIGYGSLLQVLTDYNISYDEVTAQKWQKEYNIAGGDTKKQALEVCQSLFPNLNLLATERSRKPHEGFVDAVLIAEYNRRRFHLKER